MKKKSVIKTILLWTFEILVVILFAYVLVYFFGQSRTNIGLSMDGDTLRRRYRITERSLISGQRTEARGCDCL